ncbi:MULTISPECIES: hypothetical protein [Streptomycetaceae]|uniref:hypothetical protein n=1 Tax=Streptomycetaceae TaxID=2062 RepID=UPI000213F36D|nr:MULTISPECIES: hypothetical protein [Streptomycetaceae]MYS58710.1 hypothetical protein [Streptomyces sp. SID5468]CCB74390.1 protein of unknown function [Streptantibioticus cattleyicolor NRRL 8057 = DSM 46488]
MTDTNDNTSSSSAEQSAPGEQAPTIETLQAEVEKWKSLSRKNEDRFKATSAELDQVRQASMTDAEKAIEAARAEARNATLAEVGTRLAEAELRAHAATAGVELPPAEFLNLSRLVGSDGSVDSDALTKLIASLPKRSNKPVYRQDLGLGRQGDPTAGQLTREEVSRMTGPQIMAARKEGKLDALMTGQF